MLLASLGIGLLIALVLGEPPQRVNLFSGLLSLGLLYPSICIYTKRWHDRNRSGWWSLILLVPVVGLLWALIERGLLRGTAGANRFGPDPLA